MTTDSIFQQNQALKAPPRRRVLFLGWLANISIAWKMILMVTLLFLGMAGITISAYIGVQSLRYQFSNIYDFMLIPITSINQADTALADARYQLVQLRDKTVPSTGQAQNIQDLQALEKSVTDILTRYDTEWVTTSSPKFTQDLRNAGRLDLQNQEVAALAAYHTAYDAYKPVLSRFLATVQAGNPDVSLANDAINKLQAIRSNLESLIAINNKFADFSNTSAQAAFQRSISNGAIAMGISVMLGLLMTYLIVVSITGRLGALIHSASAMQAGNLDQTVAETGRDEIALLATAFNRMTTQLRDFISTLEQRVSAGTRNLTISAEVSRTVAQVHDLDVLFREAADLIQARFKLYYTQVYLLDPTGRQLVLQAGTGEVGQQLLSRRHNLAVDLASLNGTAAVEKRALIVEDTETSSIHRPNPLLPNTRSEMVVPLMIGERVVGTLDMQSSQAGALNKENLAAFETLAGQLAIAIENATLLRETETARAAVEAQSRRLIRSGWQDFLNAVRRSERIGYTYDLENISSFTEPILAEADGNALVATIPVSNEPVGVFKFEGEHTWNNNEAALVDSIARQLGQQIENLRLLAQADQYRGEAENAVRRLARKGWETEISAHPEVASGFTYDLNTVSPLKDADANGSLPVVTHPLEILGEKIGELSAEKTNHTLEEINEWLFKVGEQLSARVENLRLFEETERSQIEVGKRARQLAAVAEVSTVSSGELDINKMLNSVVHLTQRQFGLYHAHIFLYDEKTEELKISACGWKEGDEHEGTHGTATIPINQEQSIVARAARTKQAFMINDTHNEPNWLPNPLLPDTASELAVPLIIGDQVLGVLDVQSERLNAFTEDDANIQTTLASQVAIALQNARSFAQAQKQADRETMLNVIGQKIRAATSVDAVLQIAARELGTALGAPLTIAQLSLKDKK